MKLYHATLSSNIESILEKGLLLGEPSRRMFSGICTDGFIYLAFDIDKAKRYIEKSDYMLNQAVHDIRCKNHSEEPDHKKETIVFFEVDTKDLNLDNIGYDFNVKTPETKYIDSLTYNTPIKPECLKLLSDQEAAQVPKIDFRELKILDNDAEAIWALLTDIFEEEVEPYNE